MTTVLIFSTGQTDVQLVQGDERYEFEKARCGRLHDELRNRGQWRLVDATGSKASKRKDELPAGELLLCTPKLDAVLDHCEGDWAPTHALVLETKREFASDPRFAGEIVTARLREKGIESVSRHVYLEGRDWLEDPDVSEDSVIRREVIEKLNAFLVKSFEAIQPDRVVVATTGGLPNFNSLVEELARLHGVGCFEVRTVEVPDGAQAGGVDRAIDMRFQPAAAYQARWHALSLIEKGNLLGAWGAVQHLEKRESESSWVQVVKWLAHFASALPMPPECDIGILKHGRMAVRAALRVELALRAVDIPKAVHGTVAFLESAIRDHLAEYDFSKDGFSGNLKTGLRRPDELSDELKRRYQKLDTGYALRDYQKAGATAWIKVLGKAGLERLNNQVGEARKLRNDVAHNEPTTELMSDARRRMAEAGLWSAGKSPSFLSQPLVREVLRELDVGSPEALWENLYAEVRRRLLRPNERA